MLLTNVLALADGSGRRVKRNRNAIRVALVYQRDDHFQAQINYRVRPLLLLSEMSFQTLVLLKILIVGR